MAHDSRSLRLRAFICSAIELNDIWRNCLQSQKIRANVNRLADFGQINLHFDCDMVRTCNPCPPCERSTRRLRYIYNILNRNARSYRYSVLPSLNSNKRTICLCLLGFFSWYEACLLSDKISHF